MKASNNGAASHWERQSPDWPSSKSQSEDWRSRGLAIAIPILLLLTLVSSRLNAGDILPKQEIDKLVKPAIDGQWVKGLAIGIINDHDRQILGYGVISDQNATAPDGETVYEIGSISKTFTATLLADAVLRKELELDDPVGKFLPADVKMPHGESGKPITLLHLTTHSSGLPRLPGNLAPHDLGNPYADYTVKQLYDYLTIFELPREPGEKCVYSNLGVGLLGHALSLHANCSYEDLLLNRICKPLKMQSTRVMLDDSMRRRLAPPFDVDGNLVKNWDLPTLAGAGGIRSTVDDMLRYIGAEIELTKSDLTPAIELTQKRQRDFDAGNDIGLGWMIRKKDGFHWHGGQTGGYNTFAAYDPAKRIGVVILANTGFWVPDQIGSRIMRRLNGQQVEPPPLPQTIPLKPEILKKYAGEYKLGVLSWLTIKESEDHLTARLTGQPAVRIYPESETKFFYKAANAQITFETDADGNATALVLHQNGEDKRAEKTK